MAVSTKAQYGVEAQQNSRTGPQTVTVFDVHGTVSTELRSRQRRLLFNSSVTIMVHF